jgi:predicted kinase
VLVVIGGLPGTGKSTIAREVATRTGAAWLRIDAIEQAIRATLTANVGIAGYAVGYALAEANLRLGRTVVADSVNPLAVTRAAWREAAAKAGAPVLEVELDCSDAAEHRRRVETRSGDVPGLVPPSWAAVTARDYEPWRPGLAIDTAVTSAADAASTIVAAMPNTAPRHLAPTQAAGRAFVGRGIQGEVVMLNLLRFRAVADYSASPGLAPPVPVSGAAAFDRYIVHTLPHLAASGGELMFLGTGGPYLIGPADERWDFMMLVRQKSVADFIAFAGNEAYLAGIGHRTAAVEDSRLLPVVALPIPCRAP